MWDSKRDTDVKNRLWTLGEGEEIALNHLHYMCEIDHQSKWGRALRAGALRWPWGMGWGGKWVGSSGWGTHVYQCMAKATTILKSN